MEHQKGRASVSQRAGQQEYAGVRFVSAVEASFTICKAAFERRSRLGPTIGACKAPHLLLNGMSFLCSVSAESNKWH